MPLNVQSATLSEQCYTMKRLIVTPDKQAWDEF
jgi:hypothetical protein